MAGTFSEARGDERRATGRLAYYLEPAHSLKRTMDTTSQTLAIGHDLSRYDVKTTLVECAVIQESREQLFRRLSCIRRKARETNCLHDSSFSFAFN